MHLELFDEQLEGGAINKKVETRGDKLIAISKGRTSLREKDPNRGKAHKKGKR